MNGALDFHNMVAFLYVVPLSLLYRGNSQSHTAESAHQGAGCLVVSALIIVRKMDPLHLPVSPGNSFLNQSCVGSSDWQTLNHMAVPKQQGRLGNVVF